MLNFTPAVFPEVERPATWARRIQGTLDRLSKASIALLLAGCQSVAGVEDAAVVDAIAEDAAVAECSATEREDCGRNERGERTRECVSGRFGAWSACADPDECEDGETVEEGCGLNGRGLRDRDCVEGRWFLQPCLDPDVCRDGGSEEEACGPNGEGRRRRSCAEGDWGAWGECEAAGMCANGEERREACGHNARGGRLSVCAQGMWGEPGACVDPDECADAALEQRNCEQGTETRACEAGRWGAWLCEPNLCLVHRQSDIDTEELVSRGRTNARRYSHHKGSCGGADWPEVIFRLRVDRRQEVCIRTLAEGFDPVLYVRRECGAADSELGCDDEGGTNGDARLVLTLDPGFYALFVDSEDERGEFAVYVQETEADGDCPPFP